MFSLFRKKHEALPSMETLPPSVKNTSAVHMTILTEGKDHIIFSMGFKTREEPVGVCFDEAEGIKLYIDGHQVYPQP